MKKFIFTQIALLFLTLGIQAQITIEASDINSSDIIAIKAIAYTVPNDIQPGGTGAQSWSFLNLTADEQATVEFIPAAGTPYSGLFPDANFAAVQGGSSYVYLKKTDEAMQFVGIKGDFHYDTFQIDAAVKFLPPQSVIRFPAQFNDAYSETTRQIAQTTGAALDAPTIDSVRVIRNTQRSVVIDAYGTLTLPIGSFETLRFSETEIRRDSVFILLGGLGWQHYDLTGQGVLPDTSVFYNWWTNEGDLSFPLFQLEYSETSNIFTTMNWLSGYISDAPEKQEQVLLQIHPNLAADWLTVQVEEGFSGSLSVLDFNGRQVLQRKMSSHLEQVELAGMPAGSYVLVLQDETGRLVNFRRFEVAR